MATDYLSPGEAARRLGVSYQRVDQFMRSGRLAFVQTPLGRMITAAAVETLAAERDAQRPVRD